MHIVMLKYTAYNNRYTDQDQYELLVYVYTI